MDRVTRPSSFRRLAGLWLAVAGLVPASAGAHDLWIEPSTLHPTTGELVRVGLRIGHPPTGGEPVSRDGRRLERFVLVGPTGETPVPGLDGDDPAGWVRPTVPGPHIVALRSREAVSVLPARDFESYLKDEGLEEVIARRAERGESGDPGRERYSRALKALLDVEDGAVSSDGEASSGGGPAAPRPDPAPVRSRDRPLGLPLELILLDDARALPPGTPLAVELRFEGRPLAGALVEADPLGGRAGASDGRHDPSLRRRTDDKGRAVFELPAEGVWVLTAVHMKRAAAWEEEDWQSVWTALTFALGRR